MQSSSEEHLRNPKTSRGSYFKIEFYLVTQSLSL
jgi:hypothetical protein